MRQSWQWKPLTKNCRKGKTEGAWKPNDYGVTVPALKWLYTDIYRKYISIFLLWNTKLNLCLSHYILGFYNRQLYVTLTNTLEQNSIAFSVRSWPPHLFGNHSKFSLKKHNNRNYTAIVYLLSTLLRLWATWKKSIYFYLYCLAHCLAGTTWFINFCGIEFSFWKYATNFSKWTMISYIMLFS